MLDPGSEGGYEGNGFNTKERSQTKTHEGDREAIRRY